MRQNKRFAAWFAAARRAVHLTQEQLAERMGVSQPTIGYWETEGRLSMEPEEIRRLAVHLRVDPVVVAEAIGYPTHPRHEHGISGGQSAVGPVIPLRALGVLVDALYDELYQWTEETAGPEHAAALLNSLVERRG